MTRLPEDKPERERSFHDRMGNHVHPHPRTYTNRKADWSAWERRYAAHLDRHLELVENPERMEGDHPAVLALFDHVEHMRKIIEKELLLIRALREKFAAGGELDDKDTRAVKMIVRSRP